MPETLPGSESAIRKPEHVQLADAEATLVTKLETKAGHPEVKAKGDDLKSLIKWVLSQ